MASTEDLSLTVDSANTSFLKDLIDERNAAITEYRRRKSDFDLESVHIADEQDYLARGWEPASKVRGKRSIRMRRRKAHFKALEDQTWCLLYRMGFPELGAKKFVIEFERSSGTTGTKQIDAFAADPETALVIECKSREDRGKRSLRQDILETKALQEYIRRSIYAHFEGRGKPKIIWIYVTRNIIWSDQDIERAEDANIYIITENELQYFQTYLNHMGPAGRYQVLGEFLRGQKVSNLPANKVPAIRGKLGGQTFYTFVTTPKDLLKVAFVNHQALNHPDGTPAYQRMISSTRIREIGQFIKDGGYFPTNLLVNFMDKPRFELLSNEENTDPNIKFGWLTLPSRYRSVWVIDGQHRLYGFSGLDEQYQQQSLMVLAFDGLPKAKEADLFITINHKQKSVPKSLLVALLADLKMGDADPKTALSALASATVRLLNSDKSGPLFQCFRMPDVPPSERQNLTISEAVNGLNRSGLLGRVLHKSIAPAPLSGATDPDTLERARKVLNGYFDVLRTANEARWNAGATAYVRVNPGIRAHLMLIPEVMSYVTHRKGIDFMTASTAEVVAELADVIEPIANFIRDATDEQIKVRFSRHFGVGGVMDYLFNLSVLITAKYGDFGSEEFKRLLAQRASDAITEANKDIMAASELMTDVVIKTLKQVHGTHTLDSGDPAYWELGISKPQIKERAHSKQQDDPLERRKRKEAYLDVIDLKAIVEQPNNWPHFQALFDRAMPGDKKGNGRRYTGWMQRFNDIRKIAAHKNSLRTYTDEDLEFVDWLRTEVIEPMRQEVGSA
jgi:DGQHR domain-containing protein